MGCGASSGQAPTGPLRAQRVKFTSQIDAALKVGGSQPIQAVHDEILAQRLKVIAKLKTMEGGQFAQRKRQTTLQTLLHEQQNVAAAIAKSSNPPVAWQEEVKFYETSAKCAGVEISYGSYSNEDDMQLVVTPLSRVCRQKFFEAWGLNKLYCGFGPAGTGKTETVKDTCGMLGIDCVVLNGKVGIAAEAVESSISMAQKGGTRGVIVIDEASNDMGPLVKQATDKGVMVCLTGHAASCSPDPSQTVAVEMTVPELDLIYAVMLGCGGFAQADELGVAFVTVLKAMTEKLSKQPHYDFGLRKGKAITDAAGRANAASSNADEKTVLAQAMQAELAPGLVAEDRDLASQLIEQALANPGPGLARDVECMLNATDRHGVIILGHESRDEAFVQLISQAACRDGSKLVVVPGTMKDTSQDELVGPSGSFTQALQAAGASPTWFVLNYGAASMMDGAKGLLGGAMDLVGASTDIVNDESFAPFRTVTDNNKMFTVCAGSLKEQAVEMASAKAAEMAAGYASKELGDQAGSLIADKGADLAAGQIAAKTGTSTNKSGQQIPFARHRLIFIKVDAARMPPADVSRLHAIYLE